jgi:hypothetical protein
MSSSVGYNNFNNLVALTHGWLHNLILRYFYKKSVEKMLIRATKKIFFKNSIWVSKNAELYADLKSVENFYKNVPKNY